MMDTEARECKKCSYEVSYQEISDAHGPGVSQFVAKVEVYPFNGSSAETGLCPGCGEKLTLESTRPSNKRVKPALPFTPRILLEYEVGRVMSAIETVEALQKPVAEVMTRFGNALDLEADLQGCLALAGNPEGVSLWIRKSGSRLRYGFYREKWALDALDFLDSADLPQKHRHWIAGLLFGYRADAIQKFIDKYKEE